MTSDSPFSTFESVVPVRPDDIDMNRHVHNAKYLDYVLTARYDQMERCYQMPMSDFLERGFSWFVKVAHIEHKRQLMMGDLAIVATRVSKIGGHSCHVEFEIKRQKTDKVAALGWFEYAMVSTETGRAVEIPEDIVVVYSV
jgi:acyl-CoA thioester hydrolase/thioesterase-3